MRNLALAALVALPGLTLPGLALAQDDHPIVGLLVLTETRISAGSDGGTTIHGTLPTGNRVEVDLRADGTVEEVEAEDGYFPVSAVSVLVPELVLEHAQWPADGMLDTIELDVGRVDIDGITPDGHEFDITFRVDTNLVDVRHND